jgi:HK97 family phage portal protein
MTGELLYLLPMPFRMFELSISSNIPYVTFRDSPNESKYMLDDLIYLNRFNPSLAGGVGSNLGLYETVIEALGNQIVNVASPKKVRALLQGKTGGMGQLKDKDRKGTMETVRTNFDENIQGVAYLDAAWQITPINWQENDVNRALMQFVINIVYNYFKINDVILNFKASETDFEQFVNNGIKPLARQIEQELTSKLFTQREIEVGHRIEFDTFALSISTLQAKTNLFSVASRQGVLNIDEMREMIGQPPLPNGLGKMYRVSADTINLEKVDEYQAAQKGANNKKKEEAANG